jgi:hypothetical protein
LIFYCSKLLHGRKTPIEWKRQGEERRIHVSPVLYVGLLRQGREGCCGRGGKGKVAQRKEQRRRREKKDQEGWVTVAVL